MNYLNLNVEKVDLGAQALNKFHINLNNLEKIDNLCQN